MVGDEEAYEEAALRIAQAREQGATELKLHHMPLARIPPELSELVALKYLDLSYTQVTDLTPLASLRNLESLILSNCPVSDLSPISGLTSLTALEVWDTGVRDLRPLAGLTKLKGLDIAYQGITDLSPLSELTELRSINTKNADVFDLRPFRKILEAAHRAGEEVQFVQLSLGALEEFDPKAASFMFGKGEDQAGLLEYLLQLDDAEYDRRIVQWRLQKLNAMAPEQDELLKVTLIEDKFDVAPTTPTAHELEDFSKLTALDVLRDAVDTLYRAGNRHGDIEGLSRKMSAEIHKPLQEINLLRLHLSIEACGGIYRRRGEREKDEVLSPETISALETVMIAGPGLTLGNPEVEKLEQRRQQHDAEPSRVGELATQDELSKAIATDPDLFGPDIREYSARFVASHPDPSSRHRIAQHVTNKNVVVAVSSYLFLGVTGGPLGEFGNHAWRWFLEYLPIISEQARYWGPSFAEWITPLQNELKTVPESVKQLGARRPQ